MFIVSPLVVLGILAAFFLFLYNRDTTPSHFSENPSEISSASDFGGFSQQGILYVQREPYLWYCDFETSMEIPFCSKPECPHDNLSCVAYYLRNDQSMIGAEKFNLYEGKLYFIRTVYDRLSDHKYTVEVYSMNIDGSGERRLASLDGYEWCYDTYIMGGKILIILDKYIEENEDIADGNKRRGAKTFACIDISTGSLYMLPEKSGYNLELQFAGYGNGKFYYTVYHSEEQLDFDVSQDDWSVFNQEWFKKGRITLWEADLTDGSEQPWGNGKFHDARLENPDDFHYFHYADGFVAHVVYSGSPYLITISSYDAHTSQPITSKSFDYDSVGTYSYRYWHGQWLIFSKYENSGVHVERHTAYNFVSGETIEIDSFGDYNSPFTRVAGKLIFFDTESNASGYIPYCWMSLDDFLQGNAAMKHFERVS